MNPSVPSSQRVDFLNLGLIMTIMMIMMTMMMMIMTMRVLMISGCHIGMVDRNCSMIIRITYTASHTFIVCTIYIRSIIISPSIDATISPSFHSFITSLIHPSTHSFLHLFIHPSIYAFLHTLSTLGVSPSTRIQMRTSHSL